MLQPYHQKLRLLQKAIQIFQIQCKCLNENKRFVDAINIPETNIALITPDLIAKSPPKRVNATVVIHPKPLE